MKRIIAAVLTVVLLSGCAYTTAKRGSSAYIGDDECERRKTERRDSYMALTDPKTFPMNFVLPLVVIPIWGLFPVSCENDKENGHESSAVKTLPSEEKYPNSPHPNLGHP